MTKSFGGVAKLTATALCVLACASSFANPSAAKPPVAVDQKFQVPPCTKPSVATETKASDVVVVGTVRYARPSSSTKGIPGTNYRIAIEETLKGSVSGSLLLRADNTPNSWPLVEGKEYLLFVKSAESGFTFDACGNSGLSSERKGAARRAAEIASY